MEVKGWGWEGEVRGWVVEGWGLAEAAREMAAVGMG